MSLAGRHWTQAEHPAGHPAGSVGRRGVHAMACGVHAMAWGGHAVTWRMCVSPVGCGTRGAPAPARATRPGRGEDAPRAHGEGPGPAAEGPMVGVFEGTVRVSGTGAAVRVKVSPAAPARERARGGTKISREQEKVDAAADPVRSPLHGAAREAMDRASSSKVSDVWDPDASWFEDADGPRESGARRRLPQAWIFTPGRSARFLRKHRGVFWVKDLGRFVARRQNIHLCTDRSEETCARAYDLAVLAQAVEGSSSALATVVRGGLNFPAADYTPAEVRQAEIFLSAKGKRRTSGTPKDGEGSGSGEKGEAQLPSSLFLGVSWSRAGRRWIAQSSGAGVKRKCLGRFASESEAAACVDAWTRSRPEFGPKERLLRLNFRRAGDYFDLGNPPSNRDAADWCKSAGGPAKERPEPSPYIGVSWSQRQRLWAAQVTGDARKLLLVGHFRYEADAAKAHDAAKLSLTQVYNPATNFAPDVLDAQDAARFPDAPELAFSDRRFEEKNAARGPEVARGYTPRGRPPKDPPAEPPATEPGAGGHGTEERPAPVRRPTPLFRLPK